MVRVMRHRDDPIAHDPGHKTWTETKSDGHGGHYNTIHNADGKVTTTHVASNGTIVAVQGDDGKWYGLGVIVPPGINPSLKW